MKELLLRTTFFRHGQSDYQEYKNGGQRPDLTPEGIENIEQSSKHIESTRDTSLQLEFVSSPAFRAIDSIDIIKNKIGQNSETIIETALKPLELRDKESAFKIFEFNSRASNVPYTRDPIYDNANIFEPRSCIRKRFYEYLSQSIEDGLIPRRMKKHKIICTHYELLYHFVQDIFSLNYNRGDETLQCGELIDILIYKKIMENIAYLDISFRGFLAEQVPFNYKQKKIL